ncbi:MAG: hypothetical protein HY049_13060 [Acidobacteria bacterium]|nr:hypothetical protein [Acidobacteriota bacterium]
MHFSGAQQRRPPDRSVSNCSPEGNLDGSAAALARSIAARDTAEAHLLLARLSANRGDAARAAAKIDNAAGLDPTNPQFEAMRKLTLRPTRSQ